MARIHYEAEGQIGPDRMIAALTDFTERRPRLWPGLSARLFQLHGLGESSAEVTEGTDVLGGVWARERYDWSVPGLVRLTLLEAPDFATGTTIEYRVTARSGGGCHVAVDFHRIACSPRGRLVGAIVQLRGARRFAAELRTAMARIGDELA